MMKTEYTGKGGFLQRDKYGKEPCSKCVFNPKFRFLGFALGRNKNGTYIRVHEKSRKKAKEKLRRLTSRSQGRSLDFIFYKLKEYMRGWFHYYGIAEMKTLMTQ